MKAMDKLNFYNQFKDKLLCDKICSKDCRKICCPEMMSRLCKPKRQLLEEMVECDKAMKEGKQLFKFKGD